MNDLLSTLPAPAPVAEYRPVVRPKLMALLKTARRARDAAPWDAKTHRHHAIVFPQMCNWLSAKEAKAFREEFAGHIARIEPMLGAES